MLIGQESSESISLPSKLGVLPELSVGNELYNSLESFSCQSLDNSCFCSDLAEKSSLDSTNLDQITLDSGWQEDSLFSNLLPTQQIESRIITPSSQLEETSDIIGVEEQGGWVANSQPSFNAPEGNDYLFETAEVEDSLANYYALINQENRVTSSTSSLNGNDSLAGSLAEGDDNNELRPDSFYDGYLLKNVVAGEQVLVNLSSNDFDTYLQLVDADTGELLAFDDDSGIGFNSQLIFTVEQDTNYILRASSYAPIVTGEYSLTTSIITPTPGFNNTYGYGLVDAAAAVAEVLGQPIFPDAVDLGGDNQDRDLINSPEVWTQGFTGEGVTVAVIDTGVDLNHPDLATNIWSNEDEIPGNGIDDDANGYIDDSHGWNFGEGQYNADVSPATDDPAQGHGTHVSGIIAASNNDFGITGVAYNAKIMPLRMGDIFNGFFLNPGSLSEAIRYAVDNGADVINLSLGWVDSSELRDAFAYAAANNVITVTAAGNSANPTPGDPASYATLYGISVGSVDRSTILSPSSNLAGFDASLQHIVAPGVNVLSTTPNNSYEIKGGTSMAAPHVAGVIALMLEANPNLTHNQVREILTSSAVTLI